MNMEEIYKLERIITEALMPFSRKTSEERLSDLYMFFNKNEIVALAEYLEVKQMGGPGSEICWQVVEEADNYFYCINSQEVMQIKEELKKSDIFTWLQSRKDDE